VDQQGVSITVPEVEIEGTDLLPEIAISIDEQGIIYFNGEMVNEETLLNLLKIQLKDSPNQHVAIRADRHALYNSIVRVIDIAKSAGVKNFLLITERH